MASGRGEPVPPARPKPYFSGRPHKRLRFGSRSSFSGSFGARSLGCYQLLPALAFVPNLYQIRGWISPASVFGAGARDRRQLSPGKRGGSASRRVPAGTLGSGFELFPSRRPARNANGGGGGAGGLNPGVSRAGDSGAVSLRGWGGRENERHPQPGASACSPSPQPELIPAGRGINGSRGGDPRSGAGQSLRLFSRGSRIC